MMVARYFMHIESTLRNVSPTQEFIHGVCGTVARKGPKQRDITRVRLGSIALACLMANLGVHPRGAQLRAPEFLAVAEAFA